MKIKPGDSSIIVRLKKLGTIDTVTGQFRLAVDHLMYDHRKIALQARDLAI